MKKRVDMVVAVDFDGTLFGDPENWPEPGTPNNEMIELLNVLHDTGIFVVIWTLRNGDGEDIVRKSLSENGVNYDLINETPRYLIDKWNSDPRKIAADVYIDDRNIGGLPSQLSIMYDIVRRFNTKICTGTALNGGEWTQNIGRLTSYMIDKIHNTEEIKQHEL